MKDRAIIILKFVFLILGFFIFPLLVSAHPGGRDINGCHICRTNCEKYSVPYNVEHCHLKSGTTTQTIISPAPLPTPKIEVKKSQPKIIEKKIIATSTINVSNIDNLDQAAQVQDKKFFTDSSSVWFLSAAGVGLLAGLGFIGSTKKL